MSLRRVLNTFSQANLLSFSSDKLKVPVFMVNSSNISVIKSPTEFYNTLKELIKQSKTRISLSSLYLGTGHLERDLLNCLSQSQARSKELDVTILLDYNRSTRETITVTNDGQRTVQSSKSCLLPLVQEGAKVNFYLTSKLSGWRRWIQRQQKWNELSSLHHMKLYIFDDNLIISGANLSDTYFTNRQDRYVLIRNSAQICDYFDQLIKTVSKFSMSLKHDGQFSLHSEWKYDPRKYTQQSMFEKCSQQEIRKLNEKFCSQNQDSITNDTIVLPILQMKSSGINDEEEFTSDLMRSLPMHTQLEMATGYFNLTKAYQKILLDKSKTNSISILMASEEANGFFNGKGILKYIPFVYTHYVRSFFRRIQQGRNIQILYYCRPEWSFHGKGIWLFAPEYFITMVGSTNFGYRSVYRDNEAQIVIASKNKQLEGVFQEELQSLMAHSKLIRDQSQELPKIPYWVACIATLFRSYF